MADDLQNQIEQLKKRIEELEKQVKGYQQKEEQQPVAASGPAVRSNAFSLLEKMRQSLNDLKVRFKETKQKKPVRPKRTTVKIQKKEPVKKTEFRPRPKPTIAIVSLTCCEGCQVAILDLGERFLEVAGQVKIGDFAFLEDRAEPPNYDIVFVEGAPITKENILRLKDLRARSKFLVALGACAALGGIAEIKNYQDKNERMRYVYKNFEGINNPDIKPLSFYVKVDFEIPGCPINKEEFLKVTQQLLAGVPPRIPQRPVCYECQMKQNKCLLQAGLPCLGPVILGGCGAPCPSNAYPCDGCRGPIKNANPDKLNKQLVAQGYSQKEIDLITQRFGMEDKIYPETPALPLKNNLKKNLKK